MEEGKKKKRYRRFSSRFSLRALEKAQKHKLFIHHVWYYQKAQDNVRVIHKVNAQLGKQGSFFNYKVNNKYWNTRSVVVVQAFNSSRQEAGGFGLQRVPHIQGYTERPCLEKPNQSINHSINQSGQSNKQTNNKHSQKQLLKGEKISSHIPGANAIWVRSIMVFSSPEFSRLSKK